MSDKRQNNQLRLAFGEENRSEAPKSAGRGSESFTAKRRTESPAIEEQVMEEVCERENCLQALKRVKSNKGSPGIDGMRSRNYPDTCGSTGQPSGNNCSTGLTSRSR